MRVLRNRIIDNFVKNQDSKLFFPIKNLEKVTYIKDELCKSLDGIGLIYKKKYIDKVKRACSYGSEVAEFSGNNVLFKSAVASANLAIIAAFNGDFAITRPAGHHASDIEYQGLCLFNNLALGVVSVRNHNPTIKILIIDFDGHHGNGTEMIFREDDNIMMYSLAQSNTYPVDSNNKKVLNKRNKKLSVKVILEKGAKGEELIKFIQNERSRIEKFSPDLIAVSAGFDGYFKDQLLSLNFNEQEYHSLGNFLSSFGVKVFGVLEGGYHEDVGFCINAFTSGINGDD